MLRGKKISLVLCIFLVAMELVSVAVSISGPTTAEGGKYRLEHITYGGFIALGTHGERVFAVSERVVAMFEPEEGELDPVAYHDLDPIIGGEVFIGTWTMGGDIIYLATSTGFLGLEYQEGKLRKRSHFVWESKQLNEVVRGVHYHQGRLYLFAGDTGMFVFDLAKPGEPKNIQVYRNDQSSIQGVAAIGSTLYAADGVAGIRVMRIKEDGTVEDDYTVEVRGWPLGIYIREGLCIIPTWDGQMQLYSMPDKEGEKISFMRNFTSCVHLGAHQVYDHAFTYHQGTVYGATGRGIWAASPEKILQGDNGRIVPVNGKETDIKSLRALKGTLIGLDHNGTIHLMKDDRELTYVSGYKDRRGSYQDLAYGDESIYTLIAHHGVLSFDRRNLGLTDDIELKSPQSLICTGDRAFVGAQHQIYELDLASKCVVNTYSIQNRTAYRMLAAEDSIYFSTDKHYIYCLDLDSGDVSTHLFLDEGVRIMDFEKRKDAFYLSTNKGVYVYDASEGTKGAYYNRSREWCEDIDVNGNLAAVACGIQGCMVLELGQEISLIKHIETESPVDTVLFHEESLYIGTEERLLIVDIKGWERMSEIPVSAPVKSTLVVEDDIFIGTSNGGLYVAKPLTEETAPEDNRTLIMSAAILAVALLLTLLLLKKSRS